MTQDEQQIRDLGALRIGLVSDTHDLLRPEVLAYLRGSDHIIHAGDICGEAVLAELVERGPAGGADLGAALGGGGGWDRGQAVGEDVVLDEFVEGCVGLSGDALGGGAGFAEVWTGRSSAVGCAAGGGTGAC